MTDHRDEKDGHADDCLRVVSSSAAACSCGADHAAQIAERDAWQNGLEVVELPQSEVDALLEYSTTLPTGKTIGKQWKRRLFVGPKAGSWVLCEYVEDPDPAYVGITAHLIHVSDPPAVPAGGFCGRNDCSDPRCQVLPPAPEPEVVTKTSGETVDLLAALQRSLDAAKAARPVSSPASPAGGESDG